MSRLAKYTRMHTEREIQIHDGLRMADSLLASFGMQPGHLDVAALVTLRTLQWADDDMTLAEARFILQAVDSTPVERQYTTEIVRPMAMATPPGIPRCPSLSAAAGGEATDAAQ